MNTKWRKKWVGPLRDDHPLLLFLPYLPTPLTLILLPLPPCVSHSQELMNTKWRKKKWEGPLQYENPEGNLMMLPADMALVWDRKFKKWVVCRAG